MAKYRRPPQHVIEEPKFFLKHWWHGALGWMKAHKDELLTAVTVAAVLILVITIWQRYSESRDRSAWEQYSAYASPQDLEAAVANYGGTAAGPWLKLKLADAYVTSGKAQEAIDIYRDVASDGDAGLHARYSLSAAYEQLGEFDQSRATLEALAQAPGFWGEEAARKLETIDERRTAHQRLQELKAAAPAQTPSPAAPESMIPGPFTPAPQTMPETPASIEAVPAPAPVEEAPAAPAPADSAVPVAPNTTNEAVPAPQE